MFMKILFLSLLMGASLMTPLMAMEGAGDAVAPVQDGAELNNADTVEVFGQMYNISTTREIHLSDKQLFGQISSELGNLTNLTNIFLSTNRLSGEIPSVLGNLKNLQDLRLGSNQLSGGIPNSLTKLKILKNLSLNNNKLSRCDLSDRATHVDLYLSIYNNPLTYFNGPIAQDAGQIIVSKYDNLPHIHFNAAELNSPSSLWYALHDLLTSPKIISSSNDPIRVGFMNADTNNIFDITPDTLIEIQNNKLEFTVTGSQDDAQLTEMLQQIKESEFPPSSAKSARSAVESE